MEISNYLDKSQAKAEFVGKNGNVKKGDIYVIFVPFVSLKKLVS